MNIITEPWCAYRRPAVRLQGSLSDLYTATGKFADMKTMSMAIVHWAWAGKRLPNSDPKVVTLKIATVRRRVGLSAAPFRQANIVM